jgi:hypothetical protein
MFSIFSRGAILHSLRGNSGEVEEDNEEIPGPEITFPYIGFLDVINECSFRLIPQDKRAV